MKKIITTLLMAVALSSQAFWSNNNSWNNNPWGGFVEDNGIFGFNPYEMTDPRWYSEEMGNMFDEFDDEFGNGWGGNNNYNPYYRNYYNQYNRYNPYNPYNRYQNPYNNVNFNQYQPLRLIK